MELKANFKIEYKEVKRGLNIQHLYVVDEVAYPSVSTILGLLDDGKSAGLKYWGINIATENIRNALLEKINQSIIVNSELIDLLVEIAKKEPDRIKQEACDVGSQCHNAIDGLIKGEKDYEKYLIDERAKRAFGNFMEWLKSNNIELLTGDMPVVSLRYKFGGRLDALGKIGDEIVILDWKTSNEIRQSYAYQVGGYSIALEETYNIVAKRAFVVKFAKDEKKIVKGKEQLIEQIEEKEVNLELAKKGFITLCELYYLNKEDLFK